MGIIHFSTKFELDRSTNNGDLLSDRKYWTDTHTQTDRHTYSETETDTLSI